jgi:hypothetical protein
VDVLGKAVRPRIGEMAAQELTNILSPGVVDVDLVLGHLPKLRDSKRSSTLVSAEIIFQKGAHFFLATDEA